MRCLTFGKNSLFEVADFVLSMLNESPSFMGDGSFRMRSFLTKSQQSDLVLLYQR